MSSPYTRVYNDNEELAYDSGLIDGRDQERERIIKLLSEQDHASWFGLNDAAIALIKGDWPYKADNNG
jgi:hypothetical protein